MAKHHAMFKPGEKAPEAGGYYCHVCSVRGEDSTCEMKAGQMFLACPRCLERKVAEWDLVWKSERSRPKGGDRRAARLWPGALARQV